MKKDFARRLADPTSLLLWLGIPLVLGVLISLVSSGGSGDTRIDVLVVDEDETFASELLARVFEAGPDSGLFASKAVDMEAGRARIDAGEASALVVIPAGFSDAVLLEEPAVLRIWTNPAQRIYPGIVEETLAAVVDAAFYAQRLLGPQLEVLRAQIDEEREPTALEVTSMAGEIYDSVQALEGVLFPPVLEFETGPLEEPAEGEVEEEDEPFSMALLMFPGMLIMSLLFVAQGTSEDLWRERALGTIRREACAPGSLAVPLLGKVLATSAVMLAIGLAGVALMALFFGLDPVGGLLGVVWATAAAGCFAVLFLFLQTLAGSQRGGGLVTMLVLFPLLMVGGGFFPFEAMPDFMADLGRRTPNGMALVEMRRFFDGEVDPASLARTAALFAVSTALFFALLVRRVRARFARGGGS